MKSHEWCAEECLSQWLERLSSMVVIIKPVDVALFVSDESISLEDLEGSYQFVASAVSEHGECFLPIFERLQVEIEARRKRRALLAEAFQISVDNNQES